MGRKLNNAVKSPIVQFMRLLNIHRVMLFLVASTVLGSSVAEESQPLEASKWVCEGYCFLGGDVPTNPFQPVIAYGNTEQEARDNIDCGAYTETGIACRQIEQQ